MFGVKLNKPTLWPTAGVLKKCSFYYIHKITVGLSSVQLQVYLKNNVYFILFIFAHNLYIYLTAPTFTINQTAISRL